MSIQSKLPNVGTNIFTIMSRHAMEHGAINLSQGFPDFDCSSDLIDLVNNYMQKGFNQYAPMSGIMELREEIVRKHQELYGSNYCPENEVTVTAGGSEAIFSAIAAVVSNGDEVIIFEPAYDIYRPIIELFGGKVRAVVLKAPEFKIDWEQVQSLVSEKTKMIIINNPNNPATTTLKEYDFQCLIEILKDTNILLLSDEVYEHIIFDNQVFLSAGNYPELRDRTFLIASFGKLFHITGWKTGYCLAPKWLTMELRKMHQFNVFCVNTPVQYAIAEFLKRKEMYLELSAFFQQKRDFILEGLASTSFNAIKPEGSYFLMADYSALSDLDDLTFTKMLTEKYKVATIPVSAFYKDAPNQKMIRFCFAKKNETLERALENLRSI